MTSSNNNTGSNDTLSLNYNMDTIGNSTKESSMKMVIDAPLSSQMPWNIFGSNILYDWCDTTNDKNAGSHDTLSLNYNADTIGNSDEEASLKMVNNIKSTINQDAQSLENLLMF